MHFIADFHIHSQYSRATSKQCEIPSLYAWSTIKGISVLGTGDFTHPAWYKQLKETLTGDDSGLFKVKENIKKDRSFPYPVLSGRDVKFILSAEISCIYKKNDKVRKIHNLIMMPDFESVERLNKKLSSIGNIVSDGRPILGLDSKALLEIILEINENSIFIPAHIWTPWFSLFGAKSGFNTIEECFEDLTKEIFALETGLSSDPAMNWRLSALDRFNLISNSDAHSPLNIAREANLFNTELDFFHIRKALKDKRSKEFLGTLEFYPEEGKYHYDGHRNCQTRLTPREAIRNKYLCPVCGKPITIGVLHRVEHLADREEGFRPEDAKDFESLIPLTEVIGESLGVGKSSKKVEILYHQLVSALGDELSILRHIPLEEIKKYSTAIIAEGIRRVRGKKLKILPGYDGEYGKISIFTEEERTDNAAQLLLLSIRKEEKENEKEKKEKVKAKVFKDTRKKKIKEGINEEQREVIKEMEGPVIVLAGPGTGKTYTLIQRIEYLIKHNVDPCHILAITFTNKAAIEIKNRTRDRVSGDITVGTFHTIALSLLRENNIKKRIFDTMDCLQIIKEIRKEWDIQAPAVELKEKISLIKVKKEPVAIEERETAKVFQAYEEKLDALQAMDYDDIIIEAFHLLKENKGILKTYRERFSFLLVDEFQDINRLEYEFITLLAGEGKNLFVIGDPDQSIYQFRGACGDFLYRLKEDFPSSRIFSLKKNYRNPRDLLKAALHLIKDVSQNIRSEDDIISEIEQVDPLSLITAPTDLSACIQIAKMITKEFGGSSMQQADSLDEKNARSFSDFAILVRASFLIPLIEEVLAKEGIPYRLYGERSFFEKKIPRFIINSLKLVREGFSPFRFFQMLDYFDEKLKIKAGSCLLDHENLDLVLQFAGSFKEQKKAKINVFVSMVKSMLSSPLKSPSCYIEQMEGLFNGDEDFERMKRISQVYPSLDDLLQVILTGKDQDLVQPSQAHHAAEYVSLMTIHAAKGLEFPVVFLYGFNQEILPYKQADGKEEKRLFYVAMTRCREKLYLVTPQKLRLFGQDRALNVSDFLQSIPDQYIKKIEKEFKFKKKQKVDQLALFQ
ncbi:MAG: UvrD-helicase domain-containing protein [Spirochaetes bacterium]|nr:UvrD-helicase domain-containing protein [Spirochaetota bacterium]